MPTVLKKDGYRFFFFSNEGNEPPHIHVERGSGYGKWWLDPVRLAYSKGFKAKELRRIGALVKEHRDHFLERWNDYFGTH